VDFGEGRKEIYNLGKERKMEKASRGEIGTFITGKIRCFRVVEIKEGTNPSRREDQKRTEKEWERPGVSRL